MPPFHNHSTSNHSRNKQEKTTHVRLSPTIFNSSLVLFQRKSLDSSGCDDCGVGVEEGAGVRSLSGRPGAVGALRCGVRWVVVLVVVVGWAVGGVMCSAWRGKGGLISLGGVGEGGRREGQGVRGWRRREWRVVRTGRGGRGIPWLVVLKGDLGTVDEDEVWWILVLEDVVEDGA